MNEFIKFERDGIDVIIEVYSNLLDVSCFFTHSCNNKIEAELLANHLQNEYENMLDGKFRLGWHKANEAANVKTD